MDPQARSADGQAEGSFPAPEAEAPIQIMLAEYAALRTEVDRHSADAS
jgi:hypothetical protein